MRTWPLDIEAQIVDDIAIAWDDPDYSSLIPVGRTTDLRWSVRAVVGDTTVLVWEVDSVIVGRTTELAWAVRSVVGDTTALLWSVRQLAGATTELVWEVDNLAVESVLDVDILDCILIRARPPGADEIQQVSLVERIETDIDWRTHEWHTRIGAQEIVVFPCFAWDDPDAGWDHSVWCDEGGS